MTDRNAIWLVAMVVAHAQQKAPTTVSGSVAGTLRFVEGDLLGAAEAMPESKYDYVPKDGTFKDARSFGEQLKHAACSHIAFFNEIEGKERYRSVGLTNRGRLLLVVWTVRNGRVRAVTAFPASVMNKKAFVERPR